jgi:DNA-binding transcriptional regulator YhcF (GntR family)
MRQGVIQSAHGSGCFVKEGANDILRQEGTARLEELKLLVRELHLTGVTVEDMIACVREATQNDTSEGGITL